MGIIQVRRHNVFGGSSTSSASVLILMSTSRNFSSSTRIFASRNSLIFGSTGTIQPQNPRQESIVNNLFAFLVGSSRLVEIEWLRAEIDATVAYGKFARPVAGDSPVLVAGDKEKATRINTGMGRWLRIFL